MPTKKLISFIIPAYNEEKVIKNFLDKELLPVVKTINYSYEIIIINDGSTDKTLSILQQYAKNNQHIKVVSLSRNFGKEPALSAGLKFAKGDAVIIMDADGQHPAELIPEFIKKWEAGAELVTGVRKHYQKHGLIAKTGSKAFYKLAGSMDTQIIPGATDYRLLDKVVVDEFNKLSEHNRITRGLIDWLGFQKDYVKYVPKARMGGEPSYSTKKLFKLAIDSFVSMSTTPLVIFGYIGTVITILSFLLGSFVLIQQHLLGDPLGLKWNGSIQMSILVTFLVGLVLISQSITALYISHIHAETKARPLFIVDKKQSRNIKD